MTSDNVKAGLLLIGGGVVLYIGWKVYRTGANIQNAISSSMADISNAMKSAATSASTAAGEVVTGIQQTITGNGYQMPAEYNVRQLSFSQWPVTVLSFIKETDKGRGVKNLTYPGDFAGWKVFSDGTVISPLGEYYQVNLGNPGSIDYTAKEIFFNGLTDWNPFNFKYQWQTNQVEPVTPDPFQFG